MARQTGCRNNRIGDRERRELLERLRDLAGKGDPNACGWLPTLAAQQRQPDPAPRPREPPERQETDMTTETPLDSPSIRQVTSITGCAIGKKSFCA